MTCVFTCLIVWCVISRSRIVGLNFFQDSSRTAAAVNEEGY